MHDILYAIFDITYPGKLLASTAFDTWPDLTSTEVASGGSL